MAEKMAETNTETRETGNSEYQEADFIHNSEPGNAGDRPASPRALLPDQIKESIGQHFDEILYGIMKCIGNSNASEVKRLLDYCNPAGADGNGEADEAGGLKLLDFLRDQLDWKSPLGADQQLPNSVDETGAECDPAVREAQ
jgi:hypothetical protein